MATALLICERADTLASPRVPRRNVRRKTLETNICQQCGASFLTVKAGVKCCSGDCRGKLRYKEAKPKPHTCTVCGISFESRQATAYCCGPECTKIKQKKARVEQSIRDRKWPTILEKWSHANDMRRAKAAGSEKISRIEIYTRDRWLCGLCGTKVNKGLKWPNPGSPSLDHITPLSEGGLHAKANVQLAHLSCNSSKQAGPGGQMRLFG